MAEKIYKLFLGKTTEAGYQLSQEELEALLAKVNKALDDVGGTRMIMCNSGWAAEQWPFFGIEEFPDIEAVQKHTNLLDELNLSRYIESMTVLGTKQ